MKMFSVVFAFVGLLCLASAQTIPTNVEDALAKVNQVLNIPNLNLNLTNLSDIKNLNTSALPITEAENKLREKCEKNGGAKAYDVAKQATFDFVNCAKNLVNFTVLKEEMDKARPTGDLDEVFKKYCRKKPILKNCIVNYTNSIESCLEPIERENKKIVLNVTEKILNFVCFKEGDRIALFIAAKGPECFQSKGQAIFECANATYGSEAKNLPINPANGLQSFEDIKSLPSLVFDDKACRNMDKFQTCVVDVLEGCDDPTPANLLDSIFNYIKKVTPCEKVLKSA
ncbi:hypothetical protein TKK_0014067 [Trichogramma kaykai]